MPDTSVETVRAGATAAAATAATDGTSSGSTDSLAKEDLAGGSPKATRAAPQSPTRSGSAPKKAKSLATIGDASLGERTAAGSALPELESPMADIHFENATDSPLSFGANWLQDIVQWYGLIR